MTKLSNFLWRESVGPLVDGVVFPWGGLDIVKRGKIRQLTYHDQHQLFVLGGNDSRVNYFHVVFNNFVWKADTQFSDATWSTPEACQFGAL